MTVKIGNKEYILMKFKLNKNYVLRHVHPKSMTWLRVQNGVDDKMNLVKYGDNFELVYDSKKW